MSAIRGLLLVSAFIANIANLACAGRFGDSNWFLPASFVAVMGAWVVGLWEAASSHNEGRD